MALGMFGDSKVILYVTKPRIIVGDYSDAKPRVAQIDWDGANALKPFAAIKAAIKGTSARVVLGNDISYVVCIDMDSEKPNRGEVFEAARSAIPEDISPESFDWKIVGKHPDSGKTIVQATAISSKILSAVSIAAKEAGITIESMIPVSAVLATMTQFLPSPHMILWSQLENLSVVASKGIVYLANDITGNPIDAIKQVNRFTEERFGFRIGHYFLDWKAEFEAGVDMKAFSSAVLDGANAARYTMDPMRFLAQSAAESGKDEDILAIRPTGKPILVEEPTRVTKPMEQRTPAEAVDYSRIDTSTVKKVPFSKRLGTLIADLKGLIGLSVILIAALGVFGYRSTHKKTPAPVSVAPSQAPTPIAATPQPTIAYQSYRVQVLNGSGIAGEAVKVADLLIPDGFSKPTTGNADAYTYTDTAVRLKGAVPSVVYDRIESALSAYSVTRSAELASDAAFDISVIVGSKKKIDNAVRFT